MLRLFPGRRALVTLGCAALYLSTFQSRMFSPDEMQRFHLACSLAMRGPVALLRSGGMSKYPPLNSLLGALPARLGQWLDHGEFEGLWTHRMVVGTSVLICVLLVPLFGTLARTLGLDEPRATLASLVFGLTNPLWPYSKRFYSEPLNALLALAAFTGVLIYVRTSRRWPLAGALICVALLPLSNFYLPVAVAAGLLVFLARQKRWRLALVVLAALIAGGIVEGITLWLRFEGVKDGYNKEHFTFHLVDALHGLLLGWGRSVFLFAPLTFLALFGWRALVRMERGFALGLGVAIGITFGVVACWWAWYGGVCWGPRLLLPVLPLAAAGFIPLAQSPSKVTKAATVFITVAGMWVQFLGSSFAQDYDIYYWLHPDYSNESLAWFDFHHAGLFNLPHHFRDQPWDIASEYLTLERRRISTVEIDQQPVQQVHIVHRGDGQLHAWIITDLYVVLRNDAGVEQRVPAARLGAHLETCGEADGCKRSDPAGALDGKPRTWWSTGADRRDGMWVTLDFDHTRSDIVRLELEHGSHEEEFPNALAATIRTPDSEWKEVPATAATPHLRWNPLIWIFAALAALLLTAGALPIRRRTAPIPAGGVVPPPLVPGAP